MCPEKNNNKRLAYKWEKKDDYPKRQGHALEGEGWWK